jgi:hypothetical protein
MLRAPLWSAMQREPAGYVPATLLVTGFASELTAYLSQSRFQ